MISKKLNILIICSVLCAGVLIGGFLVLKAKTGSADFSQQIASILGLGEQTSDDPRHKDTDNDGLTDWQEEIYKTDPLNPDSDGDGYLDGEEILSGYDPLKPAPNDKLISSAIDPRPEAGSFKNINLTEELAKTISATTQNAGALAFQSDETILETQGNELIDNALATALAKSPQLFYVPQFQDGDIIISDSISPETVRAYITKMEQTMGQYLSAEKGITTLGLDVALKAVQTENFSELDQYIKAYKNCYQAAKAIPVPQSWKEIHKQQLSILLGSANIFEALKSAGDDPLKALIALQQYQLIIDGGTEMINDIGTLMPKN